jgi:YVTN family beta-propeller protein
VDANNDVWVGGYPYYPTSFVKLDGDTGTIQDSFSPGCGGYGGLIDGNNVLWSASLSDYALLRYDLTAGSGSCLYGYQSYGLGIDNEGDIWNAQWTSNTVAEFDPNGSLVGYYSSGGSGSRGVVITPADNHVWIANSYSNTVTRLDQDGTLQATIVVGSLPTGVAVDGAGKVWVTNYSSDDVMRIDPATNLVDLTVSLGAGAAPYNYSDMTGSTLSAPPNNGTWTVVHDTDDDPAKLKISWAADTPPDSALGVKIACSSDGVAFGSEQAVINGDTNAVSGCQYVKVIATFTRASSGESPVLYDLTIESNEPPDCSAAYADPSLLWSPDHRFVPISILGVTDPDEDTLAITIDSIRQDEGVKAKGSGNTAPDGRGVGTSIAEVRAERVGGGNGRVYHIGFTADDGNGGVCTGNVKVGVPHDQRPGATAVDDGANYDSTLMP